MSKGVLLTQHNLITCAGYFNRNFGIREDDIQYSASPLFHMSGAYTSVVTVLVGGRTGILDTRFSVTKCWDRIRDLNATVFFGVGAMVLMLWNKPPAGRRCGSAGAAHDHRADPGRSLAPDRAALRL